MQKVYGIKHFIVGLYMKNENGEKNDCNAKKEEKKKRVHLIN